MAVSLHVQGVKNSWSITDSTNKALTTNLYVKVDQNNLTIIEVYVDDIIFGRSDDILTKDFATKIQSEFEMSILSELTYFLGLQISE